MRKLLFACLLLASACSRSNASPEAEPGEKAAASAEPVREATRVEVAKIEPTQAVLQLSVPGEVEGSRDAQLAASLGGYIEGIQVAEGDSVEKGQALLFVDSATHAAKREQAKVDLGAALSQLERVEKMRGAIPEEEIDTAKYHVAAARAALKTAQVAMNRTVIRAPFAGRIAKLDAEVGEVAAPGATVVRIVQLDPIRVSLSVPDRDVVAIDKGMAAQIRLDARGEVFRGEVVHIRPAADEDSRAFEVDVEVGNPEGRLLPGMIASVSLERTEAKNEIVIRQDWLVTRLDEIGVFVVQKETAKWRPVEAGRVLRDRVVVDEGLKAGETIVITGHRELADGDPLLVARSGVCCTNGRVVFR